jgi:4-diphosphocytidyl-2-C-methyl-D-erythritol kinase
MLAFPNAKINLGLNVTGKRTDGFHDIETVIFPVAFRDVLEILPSGEQPVDFQHSGLTIPGKMEDNLCLRAYHLLKSGFQIPAIRMHLHKMIPMGAGLGGGSSDAAFTIKLLNELFSLSLDPSQMMQYSCKLGSDCAFFIENKPVFATGRGDQFAPIKLNLSGYSIVIVIPPVHVGTAEAYEKVVVKKPLESILSILKSPPGEWKDRLVNDFEDSVFQRYPGIPEIKEKLYAEGAVYASMSGSGSAVYGLFDQSLPDLNSFAGCTTWTGRLS